MPGRGTRGPGGGAGVSLVVGTGRWAMAGTFSGTAGSITTLGNAPVAGAGSAGISSTKVPPPCAEPIEALRKLTFCNTN